MCKTEMPSATIQFEGQSYHWGDWNRILRDAEFRISGGIAEQAIYASGGNIIVGQCRRSSLPHACAWDFVLKQSQDCQGWLKFYSILIGAFAVPQPVVVIVDQKPFDNAETLMQFTEVALVEQFTSEELIRQGILHPRLGIQLMA